LLTVLVGCGDNSVSSGDRVLVAKYLYDAGLKRPRRMDVVVFRFPKMPLDRGVATNYIKRLLGLAGETLAIFFGQIFVTTDFHVPEDLDSQHADLDPAHADPLRLWQREYMYDNDANAHELFKRGRFEAVGKDGRRVTRKGHFQIIRKDPETMLALRRIVYDNDFPAKDLVEAGFPRRWASADRSWASEGEHGFKAAGEGNDVSWLTYQHILRPLDGLSGLGRTHRPQLITDFSGYNSYELSGQSRETGGNWVGDLMLDFELAVDRAQGEFHVELARGVDRFQARWDLGSGKCTLVRLQDGKKEEVLGSAATRVQAPGTYQVRVANFDDRLTVWVDRDLPFGDGLAYPHAWYYDEKVGAFVSTGPRANDLKPASLGSRGAAVRVNHLKLWRDTYYTVSAGGGPDASLPQVQVPQELQEPVTPEDRRRKAALIAEHYEKFWGSPDEWEPLRRLDFLTLYVQQGHYLCLGDNSPESSDSRTWGTVPERLMLGRALLVYYPFSRAGVIH
jgi:signal peptidase I